MTGEHLVFPDEREGLTPYSPFCRKCGNYKVFSFETTKRALVTVNDHGLAFQYGTQFDVGFSDRDRAMFIMERHFAGKGGVEIKYDDDKHDLCCGKCNQSDIVLYGEVLSDCYENGCVGCFKCGGAFSEDNIEKFCSECVSIRKTYSKDPDIFVLTLDMELNCDACPIQNVREGYGITGDEIKRKAFGRLT